MYNVLKDIYKSQMESVPEHAVDEFLHSAVEINLYHPWRCQGNDKCNGQYTFNFQ